jgi:hypothetical protein
MLNKKYSFVLIGSILLTTIISIGVNAEENNISEEKRQVISTNCQTAQVTLQQIEYNDAAARVNRGQGYETILNKYMTPLNVRVTGSQNHASTAATLTDITARYQQALKTFKKNYDNYDDSITKTTHFNCSKKPENFYNLLDITRQEREKLNENITALDQLAAEYIEAVSKFKDSL